MAMIQSSYPQGGSLTQSSGGIGPTDYLQALLGRENQALTQQQAVRNGAVNPAYQPGVRLGAGGNPAFQALASRMPQQQERPTVTPNESMLRNAQIQDQLLQMQARQQQAPMRVVGGAGIVPGYMQDVNAMNAYQREAYLPKQSEMLGGGLSDQQQIDAPAVARQRAQEDQDRANQRAGTQNTNLGGRPSTVFGR